MNVMRLFTTFSWAVSRMQILIRTKKNLIEKKIDQKRIWSKKNLIEKETLINLQSMLASWLCID